MTASRARIPSLRPPWRAVWVAVALLGAPLQAVAATAGLSPTAQAVAPAPASFPPTYVFDRDLSGLPLARRRAAYADYSVKVGDGDFVFIGGREYGIDVLPDYLRLCGAPDLAAQAQTRVSLVAASGLTLALAGVVAVVVGLGDGGNGMTWEQRARATGMGAAGLAGGIGLMWGFHNDHAAALEAFNTRLRTRLGL